MTFKSKTYYIQTYGCQMNEADSERMAMVFESRGHQVVGSTAKADVVVINTCSVRESAENRVFGLVNKLKAKCLSGECPEDSPGVLRSAKPKIILTGCMVGSARGERRRYSLKQLKLRLPDVDEFKTIEELVGNLQLDNLKICNLGRQALVPIMRGCDNFCSYCVVPYGRGCEQSRAFEEIVCEVEELVKRGYKEITLLGQNVNSYQPSFASLLRRLHEIKGIKKISFITSNPWDLNDEIIEVMSLPKIDRYLHLPVQSGDSQILKKMNRPYTALQFMKLVEKIRKKNPDIKIGTDLIVGFPGETKKQFENTVALCKKVGFEKAYISRYSPRPGTTAFKMKDNVPPEEKKRRWRVLEKLVN